MTTIRLLKRNELERAAATLARAFDKDPLFVHMLPKPEERARWLRWFELRALREAYAVGGAFTLENGPDAGAIAIYPPGAWPPNLRAQLAATPLPVGVPPLRLLTAGLHVERRILSLHPKERHVYIYVLGVDPSQKGRGLGGALLRHACGTAKEAGVVAHLETANPDNISLYRKFGFEVKDEITTHRGPPVWTMTAPSGA